MSELFHGSNGKMYVKFVSIKPQQNNTFTTKLWRWYTVWCHYHVVIFFLQSPHKRHPIPHPSCSASTIWGYIASCYSGTWLYLGMMSTKYLLFCAHLNVLKSFYHMTQDFLVCWQAITIVIWPFTKNTWPYYQFSMSLIYQEYPMDIFDKCLCLIPYFSIVPSEYHLRLYKSLCLLTRTNQECYITPVCHLLTPQPHNKSSFPYISSHISQ